MPKKVYDRGGGVSFSDVGGLLRDMESPGRGRQSGGNDSACGSTSGGGGCTNVETKVPPDEMMFNDVGGLLRTVIEEA